MKEKMVHTPAFEPDNLMETVLVQLPKADLGFLKTLIDRMGWHIRKRSVCEQFLDDVRNGDVYEYKSVDDLLNEPEP
ncbi:hypothetical protein [Bacteroides sp. An322]|uniref:hypothetical protein n=1 Tax=Bacteroides sp. An322 TaxID=1965632 RepID=UPI000B3A8BA3|nr:hypothetical protein [Bacteroides sp. An322]OUO23184.1 hypothetical protein B5F91_03595 [Bacteroides sp. An322]